MIKYGDFFSACGAEEIGSFFKAVLHSYFTLSPETRYPEKRSEIQMSLLTG